MKELYFKGEKIFEFDDNNSIQIIGKNTYLISLIVDLYTRIFSKYRYSDVDIDAMDGYYPEVKENGKSVSKKDISIIRLSNLTELIDQLTLKKDSILMKNVLLLKNELNISNIIRKLEEVLIELSIDIEKLLKEKMLLKELSIKVDTDNITYEKNIDSFIRLNFSVGDSNDRTPSWLLNEEQAIDLTVNLIELLIKSGENITIIIDKLDANIELSNYHKIINILYKLSISNSNFNIWIIPGTKEGVFLDYNIFENTYIVNEDIFKLGSFDITYDSICRNYPDNIYPSNNEVLRSLLQYYPFYNQNNLYFPSKELVIMSVFLEILGEDKHITTSVGNLTNLEKSFLTNK